MSTQSLLGSTERKSLIEAAIAAKEFAYSPYSKFRVGAALLAADGTIIKGANIENASYGGTICAERTAIVKAVSEGKRSFVGLAVVTDVSSPISPCGICRQVLREFCALSMPILLVPSDYPVAEPKLGLSEGGVKETTLDVLLPDSFGPEHLELPRGAEEYQVQTATTTVVKAVEERGSDGQIVTVERISNATEGLVQVADLWRCNYPIAPVKEKEQG